LSASRSNLSRSSYASSFPVLNIYLSNPSVSLLYVIIYLLISSVPFHSRARMVLTDSFPCMILHRRNLACRGCGCPRSENQPSTTMQRQGSCGPPVSRLPASPRFVNPPGHSPISQSPLSPPLATPLYTSNVSHNMRHGSTPQPSVIGAKPSSPTHPLLTPSGRSFAVGGKVQNVSSDPMSPCIMYWPDNEPFPEQGQIRPSNLMVAPVSTCCLLRG